MPPLDLVPATVASERRPIPLVDVPLPPQKPPAAAPPAPAASPAPAPAQTRPPGYQAFYGLQEDPFSATTDPRFLYHSTAHDRAAQSMLDAIRVRDGIVLLTGPIGIGKTLLCKAIIEQLDRRTLTSLVEDPFVSAEQLLKRVLVDFGVISAADLAKGKLAKASRAGLHAALRDFLYTLAPLEAFAVVIIDEAHKLSAELFDQIRVLADSGREGQLLQVMLVGEPPIIAKLGRPELRGLYQRITVRSTIGPLEADEIDGYIKYRMSAAGATSRAVFSGSALTRLFELSGGVPRIVNLLCERALAAGHRKKSSLIGATLIDAAADELDLAPPASKRSLAQRAGIIAAFVVLAILGAGGGLFVFRAQLADVFNQWVATPAPPQNPSLLLPSPYRPTPADQLEREAQDLI